MAFYKKIIIWLFERFAMDDWIEIQVEQQKQDFIEEHNLQGCSEEEFNEYWIYYHNEQNAFDRFGI